MRNPKSYIDSIKEVINNIPDKDKLKGTSILITGATGLIGSAVCDILVTLNREENYGMKLLFAGRNKESLKNRFEEYEEGNDFIFVQYDATLSEQKEKVQAEYVIHGASNADPAKISGEPVETMLANIQGLSSLISSLDKDVLKKVLYISSSEIYGVNEKQEPYREEQLGYVDILSPRSSYPSSKRAAETMCVAYAEEYGIETVMVRPGHIYGPTVKSTDSRASALFSLKAVNGEDIVMKSRGEQLRSYTHVLDCASAILAVLIKGENKNAYNISASQAIVTIREMAEAFAKAGGVKIVFELPTEAEKKSYNQMPCSALNSEKIEALGWKAHFDMESGAAQTVAMMKEIR
ncbi:MAG: NAD(P)-dependent oxidoreductase [Eubacterium sp.]|nr:NAD(P)-dependent oxidoreductase [Eubacterium sp.]